MFDRLQRLLGTSGFRWGAVALGASLILLAILVLPGDRRPVSPSTPPLPEREVVEAELPTATPAPSLPQRRARVPAIEPVAEGAASPGGSGRIHGSVIMPGGEAVPEAMRVALHRYDEASALVVYDDTHVETIATDAEGQFDFADLPPDTNVLLEQDSEIKLGKTILRFAETLQQTASDLRPNTLTDYLYELSKAFSLFYDRRHGVRVIDAKPEATRLSRLRLCHLTARTLKLGLSLLGIQTVEQM